MTNWNTLKPTEKQIQDSIIDAINYMPGCFAMKMNNAGAQRKQCFVKDRRTGVKVAKEYWIKVGVKGVPDIIGYYKGRFLAIEVKKPGEKATPEQQQFITKASANGCIAFVADNLDYVKNYLSMSNTINL